MEVEVEADSVGVGVHGVADLRLFFTFVFIDLLWYFFNDLMWVVLILAVLIPGDIDLSLLPRGYIFSNFLSLISHFPFIPLINMTKPNLPQDIISDSIILLHILLNFFQLITDPYQLLNLQLP